MTELKNRDQYLRLLSACREYQARADDAASAWGLRAPAPAPDGTLEYADSYRRDLIYQAKMRLPDGHELRKVKVRSVRGCPESILNVFEQDIYAASKAAASRNDTVPRGEMREVEKVDPRNGQKTRDFYGRDSFVLLPNFGVPTIFLDKKRPFNMLGGYREGRRARIRNPSTEPGWFRGR
jgi:hypothetical protein